jgi:hypothetical protein
MIDRGAPLPNRSGRPILWLARRKVRIFGKASAMITVARLPFAPILR